MPYSILIKRICFFFSFNVVLNLSPIKKKKEEKAQSEQHQEHSMYTAKKSQEKRYFLLFCLNSVIQNYLHPLIIIIMITIIMVVVVWLELHLTFCLLCFFCFIPFFFTWRILYLVDTPLNARGVQPYPKKASVGIGFHSNQAQATPFVY